MSAKRNSLCALVLGLIGAAALDAQEMTPAPRLIDTRQVPAPSAEEALPAPAPVGANGISNWLTYTRPECCNQVGGDGPIAMELFFRYGVALEVGGSTLSSPLSEGFMIDGGGRSLFFNPERNRAWTIELGIGSIFNYASRSEPDIPLRLNTTVQGATTPTFTNVLVNVRELNRTYAHASAGVEYYLRGSADCSDLPRWRVGFDGGGRIGNAKVDFRSFVLNSPALTPNTTTTIPHFTDLIGGVTAALHTDYEYPWKGCCTFLIGFRLEWSYSWSDVLQAGNGSDMQDISLLLNTGVKF
jgi:hypothetical protein